MRKEKEFTRLRDQLSAERRELPWVKVEKQYVFDGPDGKETLADLFDGRSQLIVYHFMFGPGWERGLPELLVPGRSYRRRPRASAHRDVTLLAVSRAPLAQIEAFKKRMGWRFKWVSSFGNDFNYDYHVSFTKDEMAKGKVYYNYDMTRVPERGRPRHQRVLQGRDRRHLPHLFHLCARADMLIGAYNYLDLVPKGRDEDGSHLAVVTAIRRGSVTTIDMRMARKPRHPVAARERITREHALSRRSRFERHGWGAFGARLVRRVMQGGSLSILGSPERL